MIGSKVNWIYVAPGVDLILISMAAMASFFLGSALPNEWDAELKLTKIDQN